MAEKNDIYGSIYQNLIDAGCDTAMTNQCMFFVTSKEYSDMLPLLTQHRAALLESVHAGLKQIDCLDFLIYKLNKL